MSTIAFCAIVWVIYDGAAKRGNDQPVLAKKGTERAVAKTAAAQSPVPKAWAPPKPPSPSAKLPAKIATNHSPVTDPPVTLSQQETVLSPEPLTVAQIDVPAAEPSEKLSQSSSDPLAQLPLNLKLPSIAEGMDRLVSVGKVDTAFEDKFELGVLEAAIDGTRVKNFVIQPVTSPPKPRSWLLLAPTNAPQLISSSIKEGRIAVARFSLDHGNLVFQWLPEARAATVGTLPNCILQMAIGHAIRNVPLRGPVETPPLKIDLDQEFVNIEISGDAFPAKDELALEILSVDGLTNKSDLVPGSTTRRWGDEIHVVLRSEDPAVEIRLKLTQTSGKTFIRVAPVILGSGSTTLSFSHARLATLHRSLPKSLADAQNSLANLEAKKTGLAQAATKVSGLTTNNAADEGVKRARISALQADYQRAIAQQNTIVAHMKTINARLATLPALDQMATEINSMTIRLRVGFIVGDIPVDLLRTTD